MVFLPILLSWIGPPPYLSAVMNNGIQLTDNKEELKRNDSAHNNPAFSPSRDDEESMVNNFSMLGVKVPPAQSPIRVGNQLPVPSLPRHHLIWDPYLNDFVAVSPPQQSGYSTVLSASNHYHPSRKDFY